MKNRNSYKHANWYVAEDPILYLLAMSAGLLSHGIRERETEAEFDFSDEIQSL